MTDGIDGIEALPGDLLSRARQEASIMRSFASNGAVKSKEAAAAKLRQAVLIEELVRYAEERDRELARLVRHVGLLNCRVEEYEELLKSHGA